MKKNKESEKNSVAGSSAMRILSLSFLFLILFFPFFTQAQNEISAKFTGAFTQGGLVIGKTNPSNLVTIDNRHVRISNHGQFIFGFSRNAAHLQKVKISNEKVSKKIYLSYSAPYSGNNRSNFLLRIPDLASANCIRFWRVAWQNYRASNFPF